MTEKEAWLKEKSEMEAKFQKDLEARDTNLTMREKEHQSKIAEQ